MRVVLPFAVAAALAPASALGWGFDAHRRIVSHAHQPFAQGSCLRVWLAQVTGQFAWQDKSCDPDRWRSSEPEACRDRFDMPIACEGPHHYLDVDYADPITSYPREWSEVQVRFGGWAVANGRVPWRVEALFGELVSEMSARDSAAAIDTVAHLAHYVTDAHSPMHTTRYQPGHCPDCLHLRYETEMFDVPEYMAAIDTAMRGYVGRVGRVSARDVTFEAIIRGHPISQVLLSTDAASPGDLAAIYAATSDATARRWGDAVTVLASLVGTAWVEAGSPVLAGMPSGCAAAFAASPMVLAGDPEPDAGMPSGPAPSDDAGGAEAPTAPAPRSSCASCAGSGPERAAGWLVLLAALLLRRRVSGRRNPEWVGRPTHSETRGRRPRS